MIETAPTTSDTDAAVLAGINIAGPRPLDDNEQTGRFFTQVVPAGATIKVYDLDALARPLAAHPHRKTGTVYVQDADSFIGYIAKHELPCTEVYADTARQALVGVINAHAESTPAEAAENNAGHGDHCVALELLATPEWKTWTALDKKPLNQQQFAEHLEDNAADVIHPDAATMLEIASSLVATTGSQFKSAVRLDNGEVQFRYEEDTRATAGQSGDLDVPQRFIIAIAPFVGSDPVEIEARFRYRINAGNLTLSYALLRPEQIARQAFLDHVEAVADAINPPVFQGRPQ